jgi:cytochrome oxidase Cu insertion factor (SCO1/SenC/PrrC family)
MMSPRTKFVLIFLLFSIPFVASTIVFIFWKPTVTSNYGQLITPIVALPETNFFRVDSVTNTRDNLEKAMRGKWLLVTRDSGACENTCRKKLYAMRQARLILGREQDRVVRVVLVDDDVVPAPDLVREYAGTIWVSAKSSEWLSKLSMGNAGAANAREQIYGVDTLGNAFIRYPSEPDIKKLSADFLRVLKASQIG